MQHWFCPNSKLKPNILISARLNETLSIVQHKLQEARLSKRFSVLVRQPMISIQKLANTSKQKSRGSTSTYSITVVAISQFFHAWQQWQNVSLPFLPPVHLPSKSLRNARQSLVPNKQVLVPNQSNTSSVLRSGIAQLEPLILPHTTKTMSLIICHKFHSSNSISPLVTPFSFCFFFLTFPPSPHMQWQVGLRWVCHFFPTLVPNIPNRIIFDIKTPALRPTWSDTWVYPCNPWLGPSPTPNGKSHVSRKILQIMLGS